jgi:hypothetical protein
VAFAFSGDGVRTIAYVDGFNLYYRALKGTPYKWLDLNKMLSRKSGILPCPRWLAGHV